MNDVLIIGLLGIVLIAVIALTGRKKAVADMDEFAVSGRRFGVLTSWILQAGETFTTFTFLGTVGLIVALGGGAYYSVPYVPLAYLGMYFLAPRLWRRARDRGYVSQADFIQDSYRSRTLGMVCAIVGVLILLPYIQLQITGLALIIETATGVPGSGGWSAVAGFLLVIAFVLWAGLGGIARVSYFKDFMMVLVIVGLTIIIPASSGYGLFGSISRAGAAHPESLFAAAGPFGPVWVITSMAVSMISVMFYTLPHIWPAVLAARSTKVVRQNLIVLPIYNLFAVFPMLLAYTYIVEYGMVPEKSNGAMLHMALDTLPGWAVGIVLIAGAATAMVPAAAMLLTIAPLTVNNVLRVTDEAQKMRYTRIVIIVIGLGALALALLLPRLLANMLLLTFSGSTQLVPAVAAILLMKKPPKAPAILAGLIAGLLTVVWAELTPWVLDTGINSGLIGLPINLLVIVAVQLVVRNNPAIPDADPISRAPGKEESLSAR